MRMPFTCPICLGRGTSQKPSWLAGDQLTWVGGTTSYLYPCPSCNGSKIIWNEIEKTTEKGGVYEKT